jgi:hypothetical protein
MAAPQIFDSDIPDWLLFQILVCHSERSEESASRRHQQGTDSSRLKPVGMTSS